MFLSPCSSTQLPLPLPRFPIRFTKDGHESIPALHRNNSIAINPSCQDGFAFSLSCQSFMVHGTKGLSSLSTPAYSGRRPSRSKLVFLLSAPYFRLSSFSCSNRALTAVGSSLNGMLIPPHILPHHPSRPSMGSNGLGMRKPIKKNSPRGRMMVN